MEIDVGLEKAAIWDVSRNCFELQCFVRLVELQEAILGSMKRAPDLVESVPLPGAAEAGKRPERICPWR